MIGHLACRTLRCWRERGRLSQVWMAELSTWALSHLWYIGSSIGFNWRHQTREILLSSPDGCRSPHLVIFTLVKVWKYSFTHPEQFRLQPCVSHFTISCISHTISFNARLSRATNWLTQEHKLLKIFERSVPTLTSPSLAWRISHIGWVLFMMCGYIMSQASDEYNYSFEISVFNWSICCMHLHCIDYYVCLQKESFFLHWQAAGLSDFLSLNIQSKL